MIDLSMIASWCAGMAVGSIFGCIPGLGPLTAVLLSYPILLEMDGMSIILFYLGVMISSQFTGSIIATFFGIPGETTSIVASKVGYRLNQRGLGNQAIAIAGIGSAMSSIVSLICLTGLAGWSMSQPWIYSSKLYFIVLTTVIVYLVFINKKLWINLLLVLSGLFLGNLGTTGLQSLSMTFGQSWLQQGINNILFILLVFVMPTVYMHYSKIQITHRLPYRGTIRSDLFLFLKYKASWLRGSIIGSLAGLIPAIGTSVSSNLAYVLERGCCKHHAGHLMAAESANNSSVITCLLPMIVVGLPILASESLIVEAMTARDQAIGIEWFYQPIASLPRLYWLGIFGIVSSLMMYLIATRGASKLIGLVSSLPSWVIRVGLPSALMCWLIWSDYQDFRFIASLFTIVVALPFVWLSIKKGIDVLPLVFSLLLSNYFTQATTVFVKIFFL